MVGGPRPPFPLEEEEFQTLRYLTIVLSEPFFLPAAAAGFYLRGHPLDISVRWLS